MRGKQIYQPITSYFSPLTSHNIVPTHLLEISGLSKSFPGVKALDAVDLVVHPGEIHGLMGENGAGKSTLARLVTRLYDVNFGSILIGGTDIRNIELKTLRRHICYIPRDPILFDGTLASNLRFVRPGASDRELREVIRLADLVELVKAMPDGLHQRIGPDGCQLSGGQRQRLAIARALLQKPHILILDEATSCLDPTSETLILRNVRDHLPASTLIVVSHRASTLSAFSRILVLSGGRIVDDLGPDALVASQAVLLSPTPSSAAPRVGSGSL